MFYSNVQCLGNTTSSHTHLSGISLGKGYGIHTICHLRYLWKEHIISIYPHLTHFLKFYVYLCYSILRAQYRQNFNRRRTLIGNKLLIFYMLLEHRLSALLQLHLHPRLPSFNGLGKDNCKTGREKFKLLDLMLLIMDVRRWQIREIWQSLIWC